jgi:hypothetical protein
MPAFTSPAELAMSAMQYLPMPLMVLSSLKTVVLVNEAMGRLLGIEDGGDTQSHEGTPVLDKLKGQTLSQIGIDMLQDGRLVWVTWESFLDNLADEVGTHVEEQPQTLASENDEGDVIPTAERNEPWSKWPSAGKNSSVVHDAVVEVVLSTSQISASSFASRISKPLSGSHTFAKMIITIWKIEDEIFFTLSFTNTDSSQTPLPSSRGRSRQVNRPTTHHSLGSAGSDSASHSSPSSVSFRHSSNHSLAISSAITSPTTASISASPFPPLGPPSRSTQSSAPSSLQKVTLMKDALLDNTDVPILAMWKDESLTVPNKG